MIKRLFWFGVGVAATAVVVVKGRQLLHRATPAGLAETVGDRAGQAQRGLETFWQDVTVAMRERETELREALGMEPADSQPATRQLP